AIAPENIDLSDLGNVNATSPGTGQILRWNGTNWVASNETAAPGGGEANDGSNLGTGAELYKDKSGATLQFRTLKGDSSNGYAPVRVRQQGDEILFDVQMSLINILELNGINGSNAADGRIIVWDGANNRFEFASYTPGEANTGGNVGGAAEVFKEKTGTTLRLRSLEVIDELDLVIEQLANTLRFSVGNRVAKKDIPVSRLESDMLINATAFALGSQYEIPLAFGTLAMVTDSNTNRNIVVDLATTDTIPDGFVVEIFNFGDGEVNFVAQNGVQFFATGTTLADAYTSATLHYMGQNENNLVHEFKIVGALS
ncbi:MAG: hypothetical protein LAT81_08885, partial [Oceanicaulis sp.]|nr:hypothetical protein [Oceanicaulis sp.]